MRDTTFAVTLCLQFGIVLSKVVPHPCQYVKDGLCGKGQYLVTKDPGHDSCVNCPSNTFIDYESHVCERCKSHTQPDLSEIIARIGDTTSDNVIVCKEGFYKAVDSSQETHKCEACSVCKTGTWTARGCTSESDTVCCPQGMVVDQTSNDVACLLNLSPGSQQIPIGRQERSKEDSGGGNSTSFDVAIEDRSNKHEKLNNNLNEKSQDNTHLTPRHGYSSVYEEQKRQMVEIPIWGRYMFLGIGVGIILFCLGVGIPCNACGSLDTLRHLKGLIFKGSNRQPAEEETKQPINPDSNDV